MSLRNNNLVSAPLSINRDNCLLWVILDRVSQQQVRQHPPCTKSGSELKALAPPRGLWVDDITMTREPEPRIVGWAMRDHVQVELVSSALTMAIRQQRPGRGLIHHSDRGVQ